MVNDLKLQDRARGTGELLRSLLLKRARYRSQWERHLRRAPGAEIGQSAVAKVIALYLWDTGERPDTQTALPRTLKDRVHRALAGEIISPETLNWFVDAFDMSPADGEQLRARLLAGEQAPAPGHDGGERAGHSRRNDAQAVAGTLRHPPFLPLPQRHRTLAVFEHRTIGSDRRPIVHRTTRAIMACEDGVDSFPLRLFTGASDITVRRGGSPSPQREFSGSTPVVQIFLASPLRSGQVASLEYEVRFDRAMNQTYEYRRVAHARTDNVDISLEFPRKCPPVRVWWALWDDHRGGAVLHQEPASVDESGTVHRFVPYIENAAAGFRWQW
ncbi:hypothetical protein [Actinomadura formosensis]|uniref:hypothetical protein n=1 Tax=Actinomadura formosensis TaxID=60706 RepID=UPI003D947D3A